MKICELINWMPVKLLSGDADAEICELASDSRKVGPGTLFAALPGANDKGIDGHDFLNDAYERGCRAFLVQTLPDDFTKRDDIVVLQARNTRHALSLLSRRFYDYPEKRLKMIAITGTKGKTTISYMLKQIFETAGKKVGLIGSNGVLYPGFYELLPNTTPEPYIIHRFLRDMADAGVEYCIIETTSQGFLMHRTDGIIFDAALFTNISEDHVSVTEHESFEQYISCKKQIFSQTHVCYVNRDAELFDRIIEEIPEEMIRVYGMAHRDGGRETPNDEFALDCTARHLRFYMEGNRPKTEFTCVTPNWSAKIAMGAPGRHNVENALGAICIAAKYGMKPKDIEAGLTSVDVAGRLEYLDVPAPYTVIIDYAHNKISMEGVMAAVKAYGPKRILCVFGLDSGRALVRREDCGEILGRDSDYTILSDTSPKTEDPEKIMADIAVGIERGGGTGKYEKIRDRNISIPKILDMAEEGDTVLLIGQGNRTYQDIKGETIHLDEREIVKAYFASHGAE